MPTTRKKVIKTVYKDEDDSEPDGAGDFSDSGSDAKITDPSSSEDEQTDSSGEEFEEDGNNKTKHNRRFQKPVRKKPQYAKNFINRIRHEPQHDANERDHTTPAFSVKDLTDADKLLPSFLNLSESDSSEDEAPRKPSAVSTNTTTLSSNEPDSDNDTKMEYQDVWSHNMPDNSEEIAQKAFKELEIHKSKVEETKASILNYAARTSIEGPLDVKDLLAQGEEVIPEPVSSKKKTKKKKSTNDSDSEMEDWEEVKDSKALPASGLQVVVDFPDAVSRKSKKVDIEMMMKRKMNRVKKEYQVYMHKVHVLCWLGHGNYVSSVLNDQEIMSAVLSLVPSKECYPGERVDVKYLEQITKWFNNKLTLQQDKNENKFKPKAPPLKEIMLKEIKSKVVSTKKYMFFIFVSMLRALGLQCRVMFNFVTLPIRPPSSELCSLSTKVKTEKVKENGQVKKTKNNATKQKSSKKSSKENISQFDGNDDSDLHVMEVDTNYDSDIMQVDGSDDVKVKNQKSKTRLTRAKKAAEIKDKDNEDMSPQKKAKKASVPNSPKVSTSKSLNQINNRTRSSKEISKPEDVQTSVNNQVAPRTLSLNKCRNVAELSAMLPNDVKVNNQKSKTRLTRAKKAAEIKDKDNEDVSPPKKAKKSSAPNSPIVSTEKSLTQTKNRTRSSKEISKPEDVKTSVKNQVDPGTLSLNRLRNVAELNAKVAAPATSASSRNTRQTRSNIGREVGDPKNKKFSAKSKPNAPSVIITNDKSKTISSSLDKNESNVNKQVNEAKRTRSQTTDQKKIQSLSISDNKTAKTRSQSASTVEKSKYLDGEKSVGTDSKKKKIARDVDLEAHLRVSHRDTSSKTKPQPKNDVTAVLIDIMKTSMSEIPITKKRKSVQGKAKNQDDSDYKPDNEISDEDFKPPKVSPKARPSTSRKIDRRVISSDDDTPKNKTDVWCEVFVEELEQWIAVDVVRGKVHCTDEIYNRANHPVCYVVGWDNNNNLKDLTRRYVPNWNTVTRKQRVEPAWWNKAIAPWKGPSTARDREEDEALDRMQLDAPLPKSIAEYKNHPLYVLKRHLLKYEALYPPDAAILGFVRNEPVYARECVYVCHSRDIWLKEAKVVKLGEKPYKMVKSRPKWDKFAHKIYVPEEPVEIFGPWQVQDYEPPVAENGMVPRNAYGNVELFKVSMLPKGTVHIKLPGLNKVAKKLNIDCAPAMTGFDFTRGWTHPIYDGFVVCKEFEEIITEAWLKDQEDQEKREREKTETRVYGNWKRLIKGLMIRERLKLKYGFEEPSASQAKKSKGPRLVAKKKT